jgi:hypothetical protein
MDGRPLEEGEGDAEAIPGSGGSGGWKFIPQRWRMQWMLSSKLRI